MSADKRKMSILCFFLLCLFFAFPAHADVIWPALYVVSGASKPIVIIAGLITEILFVKHFTSTGWKTTILVSVIMNLLTAVIGLFIIPYGGLWIEFLFHNTCTFHWSHWLATYLLVTIFNTLIEGLFIKLTLKQELKKTFWWLFAANALSVAYCAAYIAIVPIHL